MLSERELPGSVIFVGGGVIALEFGHVYARAGTKVTILEALPQLLPAMDADAVAQLQAESERIGIRVNTGVRVKRVEKANGRLRVLRARRQRTDGGGRPRGQRRRPHRQCRCARSRRGPVEHEWPRRGRPPSALDLQPRVYVCGDALPGSPQLSPIATYEGDIVGRNIVEGPKYSPDYASMATSVYTVPALASVGLTEAAARQKGFASTFTPTTCSTGSPRKPTPRPWLGRR